MQVKKILQADIKITDIHPHMDMDTAPDMSLQMATVFQIITILMWAILDRMVHQQMQSWRQSTVLRTDQIRMIQQKLSQSTVLNPRWPTRCWSADWAWPLATTWPTSCTTGRRCHPDSPILSFLSLVTMATIWPPDILLSILDMAGVMCTMESIIKAVVAGILLRDMDSLTLDMGTHKQVDQIMDMVTHTMDTVMRRPDMDILKADTAKQAQDIHYHKMDTVSLAAADMANPTKLDKANRRN